MAEDIRRSDPANCLMDVRTQNLVSECKRQQEACLYTSTAIYEWLKSLRRWRVVFVVLPIVFGGIATWPLLSKQPGFAWVTGVFALLAGIIPAIYKALEFDVSLDALAKSAHQFEVLRDRFRQAWSVAALGEFETFKAEFDELMNRLDAAREHSLAIPDRFFKTASQRIEGGAYDFSVDMAKSNGA
jgi:hypothetical protein